MKAFKRFLADRIINIHSIVQTLWCKTGNINFAMAMGKIESNKKINSFVAHNINY